MKLLIALMLVLFGCVPSQNNLALYGRVRVAFGPPITGPFDWRPDELVQARIELRALNALGPSFVEVPMDAPHDLLIRAFDSGAQCADGAGRYLPGTDFIEIDPGCTGGTTELRATIGHWLGHYIGMHDVCFTAGEPNCDSAIDPGPAIMNPNASYGDVLEDNDVGDPLGVSQDTPTNLDIAEFNHIHGSSARYRLAPSHPHHRLHARRPRR